MCIPVLCTAPHLSSLTAKPLCRAWGLVLAGLFGCTTPDAPTANGQVDPAALELAAEAQLATLPLLQAACALWPQCADAPLRFADLDTCVHSREVGALLAFVPDGIAAVALGRAKLDPSRLAACRAAIERDGCEVFQNFLPYNPLPPRLPECEQVFVGLLPNGKSCTYDADCGSGFCWPRCSPDTGKCEPRSPLGEYCSEMRYCAFGLECGAEGCRVPLRPQLGEPCGYPVACAPGLVCAHATPHGQRTCQPPRQLGELCTVFPPRQCATGLDCDPNPVPHACAPAKPTGAPCQRHPPPPKSEYEGEYQAPLWVQCVSGDWCVPDLPDSATGICQPLGVVGHVCSLEYGCLVTDLACVRGADGVPRCEPGPHIATPCGNEDLATVSAGVGAYSWCGADLVCDATSARCREPAGQGKPCLGTVCPAGLTCVRSSASDSGTCQAPLPAGAACDPKPEAWQCAAGTVCGPGTHRCEAAACD
ncbi:MAG: hypothetical protein HY902_02740 [Deltaproteobacteria bacterium]|nr:hypothetical protein [Deltaproteobacteria bacterium]